MLFRSVHEADRVGPSSSVRNLPSSAGEEAEGAGEEREQGAASAAVGLRGLGPRTSTRDTRRVRPTLVLRCTGVEDSNASSVSVSLRGGWVGKEKTRRGESKAALVCRRGGEENG